jgi:anti-anti-sigma regulatory factor
MTGEPPRVQILTAALDLRREGGALLFRLVGAIDTVNAAELAATLGKYQQDTRHLVLDLTGLQALSMTGARVLAEFGRRLTRQDRRLLIAADGDIADLIATTVDIAPFSSLETALDSLRLPGPDGERELRNLRAQARTRPLIGQAQEILMDRYRLADASTAFRFLSDVSQRHNVPVRVLASAVINAPPPPQSRGYWFPVPLRTAPPGMPFLKNERDDAKNRSAVLGAILNQAMEIATTIQGDLQLVEPTLDVLVLEKHRGFSDEFLDFFAEVGDEDTACSAARRAGRRVSVSDVATDPIFAGRASGRMMLAAGSRAVHSTPIMNAAGRCAGMVSTHHPEAGHRLSPDQESALDQLARQAADWLAWYHRTVVLSALQRLHQLARGG